MALTKVNRGGLNTGVSDSSNATFLTATSAEGVTLAGTLAVTGVHTVGTNAVATSDGGAATTSIVQGLIKAWSTNVAAGTSISDSFNVGSLTDNSAGVQRNNFTNNMGNANFVALMLGVNNSDAEFQWTNKATTHWETSFYNGSAYVDRIVNSSCTGDLA
jgi:hypothetical protein